MPSRSILQIGGENQDLQIGVESTEEVKTALPSKACKVVQFYVQSYKSGEKIWIYKSS